MEDFKKDSKNRGGLGCLKFAITLPAVLLLIAFIILTVFFFVFRSEYIIWQTEFKNSRLENQYVVIDSNASNELRDRIKGKVDKFGKSEQKVEFIEFSKDEALVLFGDQLAKSIPKDFTVYRMDVDTAKNDWLIYAQFKYKGNILPWVVMEVEKDNIETAQLYISEIQIGNISFDQYGISWVRENINEGISSALILVNQNNFTGRSFDNIGLELDKVVVKGSIE